MRIGRGEIALMASRSERAVGRPVDHDDPVLPDVDGNVAAGAEDDVHVRSNLNRFEARASG